MKRLLIIFTMLAALLAPGLAQADSFVYGSNFDDDYTLGDNLKEAFVAAGNQESDFSRVFTQTNAFNIDISAKDKYIFTGIGYSEKAVESGLKITVGAATVGATGSQGFDLPPGYSADELMFRYTNNITTESENKLLSNLLFDSYYIPEIWVATDNGTIDTGSGLYNFVAGTIFIGFLIPDDMPEYKNEIDFIMAISPNAVPVPAAMWLFGSGLAGLMTLRRKLR